MNLQRLINSRLGVAFALTIGQVTPPAIGYRLGSFIADRVAGRKRSPMVLAVRANQWVVRGGGLSSHELDRATRSVFRCVSRTLYDQYHTLDRPQAVKALVEYSPEFLRCAERIREGRAGTLYVIPHLSNFDLVGRALAQDGLSIQVLSLSEVTGGYHLQNRLRKHAGLEVTPISFNALRLAEANLQAGKAVLTGVDRPDPGSKYRPVFFGRPANLPVGYVRLAIKAGLPITPLAVQRQPDGHYRLLAADPIPICRDPDPERQLISTAEAVLRVMEAWIAETPEQWAMFYPVWPEVLDENH